ncbi:MAG TPA: hypothetical protein VMU86_04955 [Steroidobacteraceae bacterium]|nr:hypothetical protein [Steroidobacteraceae bacterium]
MRQPVAAKRHAVATPAVRLDLSGERLGGSLARLAAGAEPHGGMECYIDALKLKCAAFKETLRGSPDHAATLEPAAFGALCPFMPTVRRRIGRWLERPSYDALRGEIAALVDSIGDTAATDLRLASFGAALGADRGERWVRDLAAEILHNVDPERYPLMTRWVWDAGANTGVLREIWFADGAEHQPIPVADGYATFLALREELSGYLAQQGFFRDLPHYVDLLCAQVYAEYICDQGGSYLRVDFSVEPDPLAFTRRLLGLDGIRAGSGRARLNTIDARPAAG